MNDRTLAQIARNIIAGFMLTLGIIPNEGEDDIETRELNSLGPESSITN